MQEDGDHQRVTSTAQYVIMVASVMSGQVDACVHQDLAANIAKQVLSDSNIKLLGEFYELTHSIIS